MKWRTEVSLPSSDFEISHSDKVLSLGSCFAGNIADRLEASKIDVVFNPHGIIYNAASIARQVANASSNRLMSDNDLIYTQDEQYVHYDYHSDLSASSLQGWQKLYERQQSVFAGRLQKASVAILTLGTSFVYQLLDGSIVCNCHKQPSSIFSRRMLSIVETQDAIAQIRSSLPSRCQLILTVSPVRHTRDTLIGNARSKARLLEAVHLAAEGDTATSYFPSYEIVLDELRDYRYYEDDLIHVRKSAVDYVWQRFSDLYFSQQTLSLIKVIEKVRRAVNHRPRNVQGQAFRDFCKAHLDIIDALEAKDSSINFQAERTYFSEKIKGR